MGFFSWLVLGVIAGYAAKWIMPEQMPDSAVKIVLIGIVGAMLGRGLAALLALGATGGLGLFSILVGVLGTLIMLFVYRKVSSE